MKHFIVTALLSLSVGINLISQSIALVFPYDNEELTDIACSFKAEINSAGPPYKLHVCRNQDFSGTVLEHDPQMHRWDNRGDRFKDNDSLVYFLSYQGKWRPNEKWVLDTGEWYWRITASDGALVSETRKLTVNNERTIKPMDFEISPKKPLFHFRLGGAPSNVESALARIVPSDLKEYMVIDIGHSFHQFQNGENDLYKYSKKYNDAGYKFSVDLGLASDVGRIVSPGEIEKIYRDLPNFVGGEIAEMFYKYRDWEVDNSQLHACLELSRKYGKFFMFADMNWKWNKWQPFNYEYYDIFKEESYGDYFLPVFKSTGPLGFYTSVSSIQGMKLSGMAKNIGIWSDMWTWEKIGPVNTIGLDYWFIHTHQSGQEKHFPFIQHIKQLIYGITFGSTVFMIEPEKHWGDWATTPNDLAKRYLFPFMRAVVKENIIPSEEAINSNFNIVVDTEISSPDPSSSTPITYLEGNVWGDFLRNTYGISDIPGYEEVVLPSFGDVHRSAYLEMYPNSDRYPSGIPFLSKPGIPAPVVSGKELKVVKMADMQTQQGVNAYLNQYYPESSNEAYAQKIDSSIFIYNTLENHDIKQHYKLKTQYAGIDSLYGDIALMSYVMGRLRPDGKTLFFQTNAHVYKDYECGRYTLPSYPSILNFKCQQEPILESDEIEAITQSWDSEKGIFTVEINHTDAGAVDFTLAGDSIVTYNADSVVIEKQDIDILVHDQVQLQGQIYPDTLQGVSITWQSLNPAVASISPKGIISGTGDGTCKIVAMEGGQSDTLELKVTEIKVTEFELNKNELFLAAGDTETLIANIDPNDASFTDVKWEVNKEYYASVDQNGQVTAKKDGKTYVVVTHIASGLSDTCQVYIGEQTSLYKKNLDHILIYPNPAKDLLFIEGADEECVYSVTSLSGKTVMVNQHLPLNLEGLIQGIYILKIESDKQIYFKKLLIQH